MIIGLDASRANVTRRTGTERYAWEVIRRMLPKLPQHQVRLYVREAMLADWPPLPSNVEVRILSWPPGVLWTHLRLSWELLWHRPDVLFVPADTVPLIHPKKTITTIHDLAFERWPELYRRASVQRQMGWLRPIIHLVVRIVTLGKYSASERDYHRWSVRQAVRTCSKILTVSEFSKREIVDILKVAPERIVVTYPGVDQPEYFSAITETRKKTTLDEAHITKPFFLFIGRLEKKKNISTLVEAYRKYIDTVPNPIDLVLVGTPGYGWEEVEPVVKSPGLQDRIHVLGWQSDDVVDILRCTATATVILSQYEGFGLPALESLSAGVPVIASRHGSLPEVLSTSALYVDTNNLEAVAVGMQRIVEDQSLRTSLIGSGRQRVHDFLWDRTAEQTLTALVR